MSSSASSVKSSPIQADIEAILQRQRDDCQKRPIPPSTTMTTDQEEDYPPYGVIQPRRMVLPNKEQPNILNQAMAEEAAMKYEQKQGQIQQAIAELAMKKQKQKKSTSSTMDNDNDDPTEDPTDEGDDDETMDEAANVVEQKPVDANEMARTVWQQVRKGLRPLRSGWEE